MGAITVTHHEMKHAILLFFLLPALATAHLHHRCGLCSERAAAYDEMAAALESSDTQLHRSLNTVQILNANVEELSSLLSTVRTELAEERSTAQELRKKLASQPEVSTSNLPAAPLTRGARGPAVAKLQDALIAAGLMNADHPYIRMGKGMFGPYTAQIVATLQRDVLDVTPTGVYDNAVRSYLLALPSATPEAPSAATAAVPPTPLARGARGPAVAKLQDILIQLGHLHPSAVRFAKGIYGPRTTAAIAALQKTRGLAPTGTYDAAVRTVLQQPESDTSILPAAPLSHGARGPAVAQLQDALIAAGLMNADHPYIRMGKGMFGPYTAQIVATLQRDVLDVTPTGVYDNAVRSYLLALPSATPEAPSAATAAVPPTPLARGARGPAVAKLQDILIQL